ncbi:Ligand-gated chloride channel-like protein 3 [Operophtera brumata]|uniref:Ligand-gated chloride channel-like protein 3 n=1 Tax=Operophtera brumata TaxID=104452 RepID=A0A0L7KU52_OPEBR|nr:Ligand-gated chloride channel-like protein 3 [Operophtera brumata]
MSARRTLRLLDVRVLMLPLIFTLAQAQYDRKAAADRLENVTHTVSRILDGYDIRLRPNFGGDPLYVGMDLTIASFDAISEVNMDYTITLYLNQYWKDERLGFGLPEDVLTLSGDFADKIWVPDTFFANDKNSITYGMRFTATLACMMDLHYYPLDSQNCTVEIESYGYTVSDVVMYWKETPVRGVENAELPQFTILGHGTNDRKEKLATGVYQRLSLSFKLRRNIGYFVFQTYLPSILIVMLSWVLPRISYVKAIDIYLVMCFIFVFAALLEYAAVNYTYWGSRSPEEIIALRECAGGTGRVSPLLGLRSKPLPVTAGAPPSLRLQRDHTTLRYRTRPHSRTSRNGSTSKPKMIHALRRGATVIKSSMPKIRDVNVIDTYSRVIFPVCFLMFNAVYWTFYIFD